MSPEMIPKGLSRPAARTDGESRPREWRASPEAIKQRVSYLEADASSYRSHCQEIVDNILPMRADITVKQTPGVKKMRKINDSTPSLAAALFGAGVSSKMCNAATPWFDLKVSDDYYVGHKDSMLWLDRLKKLYNMVCNRSNFYSTDKSATIDDGAFGTAPIFIGEHPRWGCYFENLSIGEVFIALDPYGQVDTVFRKYDLTARQIFARWRTTCSPTVKSYLDSGRTPDTMLTIIHAVQPRGDRDPRKVDKLNMPWESVYLEDGTSNILQEGGFRTFPYAISRFDVAAGESYGRGPGMTALPDAKELQLRTADTTKAGQLRLMPPAALANEGFAGVTVKRIPGGITFVNLDGQKKMQDMIGQFPAPGDLVWSEQSMEEMRLRIKSTFYYDLMLMSMQKEMTLGEFMELSQEKMQMLGPYVVRLQTERYNPIFERMFDLLWDQGLILKYCGPPPRELIGQDGELKYLVEYVSMLAKAQKQAEVQGVLKAVGFIGQGAAIRPEIVDILDWDGVTRDVLEQGGVPAKRILSPEEVAKIRQAKAEAAAQQKKEEMLLQMAKSVPALSKEPGKGSPMDGINQAMRQGAGSA